MQEGRQELLDCSKCDRPESACAACPVTLGLQPERDDRVEYYLSLWRRVKRYEQLPDAGGLLDQEERLMKILDYITDLVEERERQRQKREQAQQEAKARAQSAGRGIRR